MILPKYHYRYLPIIFINNLSVIFNHLLWLAEHSKKCSACSNLHLEKTVKCRVCKDKAHAYYVNNKEKEIERARKHYINNINTIKEREKKRYEQNKPEILESRRVYRLTHQEEIEEYRKKYNENEDNKEKVKIQKQSYYQKNKEDILKKSAEYRNEYKDDINEKKRERYNENPIIHQERNALYQATREGTYNQISRNAHTRGYIIDMTKEEVMNMTDLSCFYCDDKTTEFRRNALDRLDNSKGYTRDNSVSCCGLCNMMKGCLDALTFVERCSQISFVNGGSGFECEYWTNIKECSYSKYKRKSEKEWNRIFELTKEEYEKLRRDDCSYCMRQSTNTHSNGIDRINSDIGYISTNCISCCYDCNISKKNISCDMFVNQAIKIALNMLDKKTLLSDISRQTNIWGKI